MIKVSELSNTIFLLPLLCVLNYSNSCLGEETTTTAATESTVTAEGIV
jgi:hypothetical protein